MKFYEAIYKIFARPVRALYRVRVIGAENLPAEGGCLLCSNHTSMRDVVVLAAALPRQPRYMAKKELFKIPLLSQLIRALGAFPVDRGGADVSSIKKSIAMIEGGEVVSLFPQGHRVKGRCARGTPIKNGAGLIAYRSGACVVPAYIKPIANSDLGFVSGGTAEYSAASHMIFDAICDLGEGVQRTADA